MRIAAIAAVLSGVILASLLFVGCPPLSPTVVTVSPSSPEVAAGETVTLTAASTDPNDAFTWTSSNPSVATVENNGVVTGVAAGTLTITAIGSSSGQSASVQVTVTVGGESEGPWEPDEFTFDVQLAPGTTMVEDDDLDLLIESDTVNHIYTFDAAGVQTSGLDLSEDKIVVIHGTAVRRISSVQTVGNEVTVETEFVPLNEVITDGTVAWDYGVEFTPEKVQSVELPNGKIVCTKDGEPIRFTFTEGDFTYDVEASLETEKSSVKITITKGLGTGAEAKFTVEGEIKRFRGKGSIKFEGGEVRQINSQLGGMQGDLTLELVVASNNDIDFIYDLPTIMKVPFLVGFLPVVLSVKLRLQIVAQVPFDGSSTIRTGFAYNSDLGFTYNGTDVSTAGQLGSINFNEDTNQTGASSAIGAKFGVAFPRVELSILGESFSLWAQTVFYISGTFTPAFPACQTADAEFAGQAGYDFSLFGLLSLSDWTSFFNETYVLLRTAECPEEKGWYEVWDAEELGPAYLY